MINLLFKYNYTTLEKVVLPKKAKQLYLRKQQLYRDVKEKQAQLLASGALDENLKQERYVHKENYNFEMYLKYTALVRDQQVLSQVEKKEKQNKKAKRLYDTTKYDFSLKEYYVWPNLHNPFYKAAEHSEKIVCKLYVTPKQLFDTFGRGLIAYRNSGATREYDFEDSNLDKFLVYDYRQTQQYWGNNKSDEFYAKQEYVRKAYRKQRWPAVNQFWNSEEIVPFRVVCSDRGDFRKFKTWVYEQIKNNKGNYEEKLLAKYGIPNYFDDFTKTNEISREVPIFKYGGRGYFLEKGQKLDKERPLNDHLEATHKLPDEFRISLEEYQKLQQEDLNKLQKAQQQSQRKE